MIEKSIKETEKKAGRVNELGKCTHETKKKIERHYHIHIPKNRQRMKKRIANYEKRQKWEWEIM